MPVICLYEYACALLRYMPVNMYAPYPSALTDLRLNLNGLLNNSYNLQSSRVPKPASYRFGSGDRFSQIKPHEQSKRRLPGFSNPGPGAYVV